MIAYEIQLQYVIQDKLSLRPNTRKKNSDKIFFNENSFAKKIFLFKENLTKFFFEKFFHKIIFPICFCNKKFSFKLFLKEISFFDKIFL